MVKHKPSRLAPCQQCIAKAQDSAASALIMTLCEGCTEQVTSRSNSLRSQLEAASLMTTSSITLLLPKTLQHQDSAARTATYGYRTDPTKQEASRNAIAAQIKKYSQGIVDAINTQDPAHPALSFICPAAFHASDMDRFPGSNVGRLLVSSVAYKLTVCYDKTWHEHVETFRAIQNESPDYHMGVQSLTVDVEDSLKKANAFVVAEISGRPLGVTRESLGVLKWVHTPHGWRCMSHTNMRAYDPTKTKRGCCDQAADTTFVE